MRSRQSSRTVRTQRSAKALALGARTGVRIVATPIEAKTSAKLFENFVSRLRTKNCTRRPASPRSEQTFPRHLGGPGSVGVRGDAEKMHDTSLDLDDEEHVVATEQDRVDGQEVAFDDDLG